MTKAAAYSPEITVNNEKKKSTGTGNVQVLLFFKTKPVHAFGLPGKMEDPSPLPERMLILMHLIKENI